MKKCEFLECGYFNESKDNNCGIYNDLSFIGCTCDSNCEAFKTKKEAKLLEKYFHLICYPDRYGAARKAEIEIEKLKAERERRKNEQNNII